MALPSYSTGTISIVSGGTTVTGVGTLWSIATARAGDVLQVGNFQTIITDLTDTTHLIIPPWGGGTVSGVAYKIFHSSPLRFAGGDAMADVATMIALLNSTAILGGSGDTTFVTGADSNVMIGQGSDSPTYNIISLNGDLTDAGYTGFAGGATGDPTLYVNSGGFISFNSAGGAGAFEFSGESYFYADLFAYDHLFSLRGVGDENHGLLYNATIDGPEYRGYFGHIWKTGSLGATEAMRLTAAAGLDVAGIVHSSTAREFRFQDANHGMKYNATIDGPLFMGYGGFIWGTGSAGATEFMRIQSDALLIGHPTAVQVAGIPAKVQIVRNQGGYEGIDLAHYENDSAGFSIAFGKSRGATNGTHTVVQNNDGIMGLNCFGSNGTGFWRAAWIRGFVDAAVAGNSVPGRLMFGTTKAGDTDSTEWMRIANAGSVMIGATTPTSDIERLIVSSDPTAYITSGFYAVGANSAGAGIFIRKTRNSAIASHTVVQSGDRVGLIAFQGSDGSAYRYAAAIACDIDGTPGSSDMPGKLVFMTTPDGSASPAERKRITNGGHHIYTSATTTPPTLGANGEWVMTPTSNTNMRISYRGSDGTTRVGNITLA